MNRRAARAALAAIAVALAAGIVPRAAAQPAWPVKPIRIVVPFPAGGTTDILARAAAQKMSEAWKEQAVVDNRPGAGGNIGAELVAKAPADGYTMLMGTVGTHAINASLYARMPYDHVRDFAPVILVAAVPNVMVVHPAVPANTVPEFIAWARANPGKVNFASSGSGTSIHLAGELFKTQTGLAMTHVPYKGSAPAIADLVGGQVQVMFDNLPSALAQIRGGKLRALAVTSKERAGALPDVPTLAESGLPGFEASSWFGLVAPAGTPREVVGKVNSEIARWLASPDAREKLASQGALAAGGTPEDFVAHIVAETAKWQKVVRDSGAKVD